MKSVHSRLLLFEFLDPASGILHTLVIRTFTDQTRNVGIVEFLVLVEVGTVLGIRVRVLVKVFLSDVVTGKVDGAGEREESIRHKLGERK